VDPSNGRIAIDVPLQGTLFELTRRQAEELKRLGERHGKSASRPVQDESE
jgi:hypothetical protein